MTNLSKFDQMLHDASDKEIVDALRYLGKAERIAAALNQQAGLVEAWDMPSEDEYPDTPEYEREVAWRQGWNAALAAAGKGVGP